MKHLFVYRRRATAAQRTARPNPVVEQELAAAAAVVAGSTAAGGGSGPGETAAAVPLPVSVATAIMQNIAIQMRTVTKKVFMIIFCTGVDQQQN